MNKEIEFSAHALLKIEILRSHGFNLSKEDVEKVLRDPDILDIGYKGRLIAQRVFDESHVLRVIYEERAGKIYVITIYPGRRSRYEKNKIQ
ncbi:MAG: DUF4258 domain-containing protein [Thermodesulfovibrionales bacterium]